MLILPTTIFIEKVLLINQNGNIQEYLMWNDCTLVNGTLNFDYHRDMLILNNAQWHTNRSAIDRVY